MFKWLGIHRWKFRSQTADNMDRWKSRGGKRQEGGGTEVRMSKKCTPLWREEHFQVKSVKNWWVRTTFGRSDVEKVRAVVAPSTFESQKCRKQGFEPLLTFRCRKSAHEITYLSNLTNLANLPYLTYFTYCNTLTSLTILTNLPNLTTLTNFTNLTILTNLTYFTSLTWPSYLT